MAGSLVSSTWATIPPSTRTVGFTVIVMTAISVRRPGGTAAIPREQRRGPHWSSQRGRYNPRYAGGTGSPCPCESPYSGTPTGAAQSDELRGDLQQGRGAPHGRKRDGSPATGQESEFRAVRMCFDGGPEWSVHTSECRRDDRARLVYLLSLSDGVGTAMLAMVEPFTAPGCQDRFEGGWFAESEDHLASPVARHWADRRGQGGPSYERVAGEVWDLLRHKGRALAGMLAEVEPGALLVIIGGSPFQQLTLAGHHGGKEGLWGRFMEVLRLPADPPRCQTGEARCRGARYH